MKSDGPRISRGNLTAVSGALVACISLLTVIGCVPAGEAEERVESRAEADPVVTRGDFERELLLTGELEAVRSITIKAPQTALFQMRIQFMAEEGSVVKKGDPLLDFDNSSLAAQMRDLEIAILDAETQIVSKRNEIASALKDLEIEIAEREYEYERTKLEASVDPEVVSRKEYSERRLAFEKAASELEETRERIELTRTRGQAEVDVLIINRDKLRKDMLSAQNDLELLSIKAPAEGLVVYRKRHRSTLRYQEGDSCWPGQAVMHLPDLTEMQVAFSVNEVDAPLLEVGMPVRVSLDAFPGRELSGELLQIPSMAVKRDEGSKIAIFKVTASLSETWVGEMKPGMSVLGRVVVDRMADVPVIARRAVSFDGESYRVRSREGNATVIHPVARNERVYVLSESEYALLTGASEDAEPRRAAVGEPS